MPVRWLPTRQQLYFCSIHSQRPSSRAFGLDRPGNAVKSNVSKSFSTGNSAFLIRAATALAARAASSISVRRSRNWVNVWLLAAASRASVSNSRPIVGSRNCRKRVLSNSVVTSAIGMVLSETGSQRDGPGPTVEPGPSGSGEEHADRGPWGVIATPSARRILI